MIAGDEDIIRQHATFRYNQVKSKYMAVEGRIKDVKKIFKLYLF